MRHAGTTFLPSLFTNDNIQASGTKEHPSTIINTITTTTTAHKPAPSYQSIIMPPAFTECHIHLGHNPNQIDDEKASHHLQESSASHNAQTHDPSLLEVTSADRVSSSSALLYSSPQPTLDASPSSSSSSTPAIMGMDALTSQEVASGLLQTESDLDAGNISDRDYSDGKVCVPDTLGAETVVETSSLDGKFLNASTKRVSQAVLASKGNIDANYLLLEEDGKSVSKVIQAEDLVEIFETQTLQAFLAQRDSAISSHSNSTDKNSLNSVSGESPMTKGMSIVYVGDEGMQLVPTDTIEEEEEEDDCNLPTKDVMKRERDRMKKREQRANPMYREKEKEKAKARMRMMRADPNYRERERRRDRIRRKISRQQNNELRQKEKDRDKEYKRLHRNLPLNSVMTEVEIGTNEDSGMGTNASIGTGIGSGGTKTVLELHPQHFALRQSVLTTDVTQLGGIDDGVKMVSEASGIAPTDLNCMTLNETRAEAVLTCPVSLQYTLTTDGHRIMT